jgi:large subunit ribosomal protein L7/L12
LKAKRFAGPPEGLGVDFRPIHPKFFQKKGIAEMSEEAATVEYSDLSKDLGDKIAELTLKQAKELSDYLKDVHGIEAAAGGAVMMAGPAAGGGEEGGGEVEKTEFDVVLTSFGDAKLNVVKVVKNLTGASLMEAKKMVEGVPATLKEAASKEDAEKMKGEIEEAGGTVELK